MFGMRAATHNTHRLATFCILILSLTMLLSACGAQQPKTYRVGILSGLEFTAPITDAFKDGMTELGYVEGQNIVYDVQTSSIDIENYQHILQGFVASDVDLILAFPTEASIEAKALTAATGIPVVFSFAAIEGMGLIASISEPGENITGVRLPAPELAVKRFEVMRQIVPQAERILVPYLADYPNVPPQLEALHQVAAAAGVELVEMPVASPPALDAALAQLATADDPGVDAVLQLVEPVAVTPAFYVVLARFAAEYNLPMGGAIMAVDGYESLFGINARFSDIGQHAAALADKIFHDIPAGTIPVISPDSFFQFNYREAQRLGLTVSEGLLSEANEIIR